jgi:Alr-MurF fusion protein
LEFTLKDIAGILKASVKGSADLAFSEILTDSRTAVFGQKALFAALTSGRNNGHNFIAPLYEKGIRCFLISDERVDHEKFPGAGFVLVNNTLTALQELATHKRSLFKIPVVGITGSNGKTVVKEWLYQLLNDELRICRSPKSFNSQIGVPLSVWQLNDTYQLGIFEAGISQPGEMEHLEKIIQPDLGIITNIKAAHDEHFSSRQEKTLEKLKLFVHCKKLFYCADSEQIPGAIKAKAFAAAEHFSWGKNGTSALHIISRTTGSNKTEIKAKFKEQEIYISIPFTDDASFENACHCWLYMLVAGYDNKIIAERMALLEPVAMRLEMKQGMNNSTLINDSYNSDLESLSIALDFLNRQHQHPKKTIILSDIYQSGKNERELYADVARLLSSKHTHRVIGIGPALKANSKLFAGEKLFFSSTAEFIKSFNPDLFNNEAVLIKGSRSFEFEKISTLLQQKSHDTILEINLAHLVNNLNYFKSRLKPGVGLMAMVKAFSYGSGSYEIASALQYHHVNYLAVAYADEGVELRRGGIKLPIMVMNPEPQSFESLIHFNLEPEIFSFGILSLFTDYIKNYSADKIPLIHIKLDTGMHRLGFSEAEIDELCKKLSLVKQVRIASLFSHLAASDEPGLEEFTREQIKTFDRASTKIVKLFPYKILRHLSNSAGISLFPEAQFDMVRLGIGMYGIGCGEEEQKNLLNVGTLKTTISQVKELQPGDTVGYSRKGQITKPTSSATVPIGYADGYSRRFGNGKGSMYVKGKKCPVIGNVCMDMTMIDVSGTDAREGDEVIVFSSPSQIMEMATAAETIPYEILTSVSPRVKRVYLQE